MCNIVLIQCGPNEQLRWAAFLIGDYDAKTNKDQSQFGVWLHAVREHGISVIVRLHTRVILHNNHVCSFKIEHMSRLANK